MGAKGTEATDDARSFEPTRESEPAGNRIAKR
jgi:hypothetical protein